MSAATAEDGYYQFVVCTSAAGSCGLCEPVCWPSHASQICLLHCYGHTHDAYAMIPLGCYRSHLLLRRRAVILMMSDKQFHSKGLQAPLMDCAEHARVIMPSSDVAPSSSLIWTRRNSAVTLHWVTAGATTDESQCCCSQKGPCKVSHASSMMHSIHLQYTCIVYMYSRTLSGRWTVCWQAVVMPLLAPHHCHSSCS